jgi:hypothetical protein
VPTGNESNSLTSISILEWFPVVCNKVMFDGSGGSYITFFNPTVMTLAMKLLLKLSEPIPVDVFTGKIKLSRDVTDHNDAFRYTLAHEIQHAINALSFAYPALTNWKGFMFNIIKIDEVRNTNDFDQVTDRLRKVDMIQDEGSLEEQLEMLRKSFGSSINIWQQEYIKIC